MRKILLFIALSFTLIGCGGGSSDTTNSSDSSSSNISENFPTQNISGSSFDTWQYIIPEKTSTQTRSISSRSIDGTTYHATFRSIEENNIVEEIPSDTIDERIIYEKNDKSINVKFFKNDKITYMYNMIRFVKIGEQTVENSSCMLVNHFSEKNFGNRIYNDVIEIDCGKHKGFYAKGKGQIYQE